MTNSNEIVKNFKASFDSMSAEGRKAYLERMGYNFNSTDIGAEVNRRKGIATGRCMARRRTTIVAYRKKRLK